MLQKKKCIYQKTIETGQSHQIYHLTPELFNTWANYSKQKKKGEQPEVQRSLQIYIAPPLSLWIPFCVSKRETFCSAVKIIDFLSPMVEIWKPGQSKRVEVALGLSGLD